MPADESRVRWIVKVILMQLAECRKSVSNVQARIQLLTYIKIGKKARLNGLLIRAFDKKPGLWTLVYVLNDRFNNHDHRWYDFEK